VQTPNSDGDPGAADAVAGGVPASVVTGGLDEFDAIDRLRVRFEAAARGRLANGDLPPAGEVWIGDDAAVVRDRPDGAAPATRAVAATEAPGSSGVHLLATDLIVDGVHVDRSLGSLRDLGFKAVMVTVSDLAAMGGWPDHLLVSIAAPPGTDLDEVGAGMAEAAEATGSVVVGGDLSEAPVLVVSTVASGRLRGLPGPLLRSGARAGHHLVVTGPLGGSAAGLRVLRADLVDRRAGEPVGVDPRADPDRDRLRAAYRRPVARLHEGETARLAGASAAIDISDGLAADVSHLAVSSGVGVRLAAIPVVAGATAEEALHGGEDYELVVATPDPGALADAFAAAGLRPPLAIGICTDRPGELTLDGDPVGPAGWRHRF
jgi:thiamine-monophosphate kinase